MGNVARIVFSLNPFRLSCFKAFQARFPWVQWAQWAAGFFGSKPWSMVQYPPKIKQSIGQIDHNVRNTMFDFTPQKTGHGHLPVRNLKFCNSHVRRFPKAWGYPNSWMVLENPICKWMIWGTLILGNQFHDTRVKFFLVRFRCSSD